MCFVLNSNRRCCCCHRCHRCCYYSHSHRTSHHEDLPQLKAVFISHLSTREQLIEAVRGVRRLLSVERNPPINEVLSAGVLPYLVKFLRQYDTRLLMLFESALALTYIASADKTTAIVDALAVPPLIDLLRHDVPDIREQAAGCLGAIAGVSLVLNDHLLDQGILEPL